MREHGVLTQFNTRVIVSGNVVEKYVYQYPVAHGFAGKRKGRANASMTTDETKTENRKKTAIRARATVRRMVNANPHLNKFLTLTYAENVTDIDRARYDFDKFVKRVKTRFSAFQYICIPEFQKRGAVHFHLLCNLPYVNVDELAREVWGHGFIRINRIDHVDNVGAYVTKYMTKDSIDERLTGKKCYTMSKGLNEPQTLTDEEDIQAVEENLENVSRVYSTEFESDYYGKVVYTQIVCRAPVAVPRKRCGLLERVKACFALKKPLQLQIAL